MGLYCCLISYFDFLIVTYGKLRELEIEILKMKTSSLQMVVDISDMLKVSVEQFYGFEYEEFPCQIAQVGMWLADHQINLRVSERFGIYYARLPLANGATIVHGNALRMDWEPTQKIADTPTRFHVENMLTDNYIAIPEVSSERRKYIPIGFLTPEVLCSNKLRIIPNGTMYHFGILTSNVHMAWMRAVCCRLKSDYSYSNHIVYYNFPWPTANENEKKSVEVLAQAVLDARAKYPDSSLADLYDPLAMPPDLLKAHRALDSAVMKLYGFPVKKDFAEADCMAALMEMYKMLVDISQ